MSQMFREPTSQRSGPATSRPATASDGQRAAARPRHSSTEISVESRTTSRRTFLSLSMGLPLGAALAACGSSGPTKPGASSGGGGAKATYWYLSTQPQEGIRTAAMEQFNKANPNGQIAGTTFQNDAFKTKIKTAIGAGQAPTIIWGWGGGGLRTYVEADQGEGAARHTHARARRRGAW